MPTEKLENLLKASQNRELGELVDRAGKIGELTAALAGGLPAELADSLVAANPRPDGTLVVIARSPAWAARLRFEEERLLEVARSHGVNAETLLVRVSHISPQS